MAGVVVATFVVRFILLGDYPTATSNDAGAWLTAARVALGDHYVAFHTNRFWPFGLIPLYNLEVPFIPVLPLALLVSGFGGLLGLKLFMILASVLPIPAAYYLFLKLGANRMVTVVAGTAFAFTPTYATMFAWANFDGLFGLTFLMVALGSIISYLARPDRRGLLISAVAVALTAGSDTMYFAVLFVTLVLFGVYLALRRRLQKFFLLAKSTVLGLLIASPFFPIYLDLYLARGAATSQVYSPAQVLGTLYSTYVNVLPDVPVFVIIGILVTMYASIIYWRQDDTELALIGAVVLSGLALTLTILSFRAVRFWYILPVPAFMIGGVFFTRLKEKIAKVKPPRTKEVLDGIAAGLLIVLLIGTVATGVVFTAHAYKFYEDLDQPRLDALSWLGANTPVNATVLTSAGNANSPHFNEWVSGIAGRNAVGEEYSFIPFLPDLTYANEQLRAHLAALALRGNLMIQNGMVMMADGYPYAAPYRPLVGVYVGDYQPVAFVDWRNTSLTLVGPAATPPGGEQVALSALGTTSEYAVSRSNSSIAVSYVYGEGQVGNGIGVTNSLVYGQRSGEVTYSWSGLSPGALPSELDTRIGIFGPITAYQYGPQGLSFTFLTQFGTPMAANISLSGSGTGNELQLTEANSSLYYLTVHAALPQTTSGSLSIRFSFGTMINPQPLAFYDFQSIQQRLGFSYVVIFKFRLPYDQFVPYVGTLVYENSAVEIFRVNAT
ncbi:MAG: hypothetical protein JRN31_01995 [Nitrososphaerota archaeon]|nr:hypothetical protein [Nitrososphaerota archaeon]MDG6983753.1 hypothetical protein [Nitrososphaerota archaeon]MDG7017159.1 hypothetical protein [Nitrososphaerota archaeon]